MTRALIHTPGKHAAILTSVDHHITAAKKLHMVQLTYKHSTDSSAATIRQHILWTSPEHEHQIPEMGAFIMSRIFSQLRRTAPERNSSFWLRYDVHEIIKYLQAFVGERFELTIESRTLTRGETVPNIKYAYCLRDRDPSPQSSPPAA